MSFQKFKKHLSVKKFKRSFLNFLDFTKTGQRLSVEIDADVDIHIHVSVHVDVAIDVDDQVEMRLWI